MLPRRPRSSLIAALIAALVLLQTLGLVHRIAHGGQGRAVHASATKAGAKAHWVDALFAGHDQGSTGCDLYDQLLQPQVLVDAACAATPAFAPPRPAEVHRAWHLALQALGYLARGPPNA